MKQKTILVITDGIGHSENAQFNAFAAAKKPTYEWLFKNVPNALIKTSGLAVGLPEGQMGNSEVGHMCIGSGRVLYQNLVKISLGFENGSLAKSEKLLNLFKKCKTIHVIGLYSDGGVHSHLSHFDGMCELASANGCEIYAHAITDGRDVSPKSGLNFIKALQAKFKIASISGRFYAMDRDKRWERVKLAYEAMMGENPQEIEPFEYVMQSYEHDVTDEFIVPASFNGFRGIGENDGVIFINFRNDRAREICAALGAKNFSEFARPFAVKNLLTMTEYDANFAFPVLFENERLQNTLAQVIANAGLTQLHTAETEKYAHVTFFFNGGVEELVPNETRILIPSPKVKTYDEKPEMSAPAVCDAVIKGMDDGQDFIVVNFANGDMVGHTGDFDAAVKAVEAVDTALGRIVAKAKERNYALIITSDHGNCEEMRDAEGKILTNHTTYDVLCFIMGEGVRAVRSGGLNNIAASVLRLMGLEKPAEMDEALF
ncbi:2,3-bisphosphoglycerate-independent phosphoglycerate mutase [Campylobacter curvus]|uniref:2,3-bisphosphoglycerate-independent phosphoglycerate mutase n=1 Tax=Campylobacter curvus (strain 525.92) TaxID=360105 RepID=A7GWQ8_CAMC5|nr:2,3-bisphosphoglycerate-independent phosphoglycerate mutase [Campylobacter curvus]EAT99654.1 phosphoglycerate mutase [Campylobacter curvus 525.92]